MRLIVKNLSTQVIIGGADYLLGFDLMQKLKEYLRVRPDRYGMNPAYKKGNWDGYRYFITSKGEFATGYLPLVLKYCTELGVTIVVEDQRSPIPKLKEEFNDYIGVIDGEEWIGRDYQVELAKKVTNYIETPSGSMYFPRGILDAATNAGKNSVAAMLIKNLDEPVEVLFMVASIDIYKQAVKFFREALEEEIGEIKSGMYKPKRVTVAMVKSLYAQAQKSLTVKKFLLDIKVLIVDESDEAGATVYSKCLMLVGAGMRVFVSGTPLDSKKVNNMINVGLSGPVLGKITNAFLIEKGYSQKPLISIVLNNMGESCASYDHVLDEHIHKSTNRATLVAKLIEARLDRSVLITFTNIEHGQFMYDIARKYLPDADMDLVHGEDPDRAYKLEAFKTGRISVLFASMIVKRGLNNSRIACIIMAQGGKSKSVVKQITGRGLRSDGVNSEMEIIDFYDTGDYVSDHSRARIRVYKAEGFDVNFLFKNKRGKPI